MQSRLEVISFTFVCVYIGEMGNTA